LKYRRDGPRALPDIGAIDSRLHRLNSELNDVGQKSDRAKESYPEQQAHIVGVKKETPIDGLLGLAAELISIHGNERCPVNDVKTLEAVQNAFSSAFGSKKLNMALFKTEEDFQKYKSRPHREVICNMLPKSRTFLSVITCPFIIS